jgi:DNA helicase-2/ATP-dependent DNA helicase PcrA
MHAGIIVARAPPEIKVGRKPARFPKTSGRSDLPLSGPHRDVIAVRDDDRVLQILAGPGSGKTEMLVWRVLYDLCVRGTPSDAVMVTTFTRRAATELNVRVVERCDQLLQGERINCRNPKGHNSLRNDR